MALLKFSIKHTLAQALSYFNVDEIFFPKDSNTIVLHGREYGSDSKVVAEAIAGLRADVDGLREKDYTEECVKGPYKATDGEVAVFEKETGKQIKGSGFTLGKSVPADAKFTDTVYTHPSAEAAAAAAVKVGRDAQGHVVIGSALTPGDIGAQPAGSYVAPSDLPAWVNNDTSKKIPAGKLPEFVTPSDLESAIEDLVGIDASGIESIKNIINDGDPETGILVELAGKASKADLNTHVNDNDNPHQVTKSQIGLGNVGNFKAVSTVANQSLTATEKLNARTNIGVPTKVSELTNDSGYKTTDRSVTQYTYHYNHNDQAEGGSDISKEVRDVNNPSKFIVGVTTDQRGHLRSVEGANVNWSDVQGKPSVATTEQLADTDRVTAEAIAGLRADVDGLREKDYTEECVKGPYKATDGEVAVFEKETGKQIKGSGFTLGKSVPADAKFTDTVYTHPSAEAAAAAAVKVGRDAQGHVVIGSALTPGDIGAQPAGSYVAPSDLPAWVNNDTSKKIPAGKLPEFVTPSDLESAIEDLVGIDASGIESIKNIINDGDPETGILVELAGKASKADLNTHKQDTSNPHGVTKAQVGLGNVDNTSDMNKPISTATQNAINADNKVLAAAIAELKADIEGLRKVVEESPRWIDAEDGFTIQGQKLFDICNGAPTTKPKAKGLIRMDASTGHVWMSKSVTNSTADWKQIV